MLLWSQVVSYFFKINVFIVIQTFFNVCHIELDMNGEAFAVILVASKDYYIVSWTYTYHTIRDH